MPLEVKAIDTQLQDLVFALLKFLLLSNLGMFVFFPFRMGMYQCILEVCNYYFFIQHWFTVKRHFNLETSEWCWDF